MKGARREEHVERAGFWLPVVEVRTYHLDRRVGSQPPASDPRQVLTKLDGHDAIAPLGEGGGSEAWTWPDLQNRCRRRHALGYLVEDSLGVARPRGGVALRGGVE